MSSSDSFLVVRAGLATVSFQGGHHFAVANLVNQLKLPVKAAMQAIRLWSLSSLGYVEREQVALVGAGASPRTAVLLPGGGVVILRIEGDILQGKRHSGRIDGNPFPRSGNTTPRGGYEQADRHCYTY